MLFTCCRSSRREMCGMYDPRSTVTKGLHVRTLEAPILYLSECWLRAIIIPNRINLSWNILITNVPVVSQLIFPLYWTTLWDILAVIQMMRNNGNEIILSLCSMEGIVFFAFFFKCRKYSWLNTIDCSCYYVCDCDSDCVTVTGGYFCLSCLSVCLYGTLPGSELFLGVIYVV